MVKWWINSVAWQPLHETKRLRGGSVCGSAAVHVHGRAAAVSVSDYFVCSVLCAFSGINSMEMTKIRRKLRRTAEQCEAMEARRSGKRTEQYFASHVDVSLLAVAVCYLCFLVSRQHRSFATQSNKRRRMPAAATAAARREREKSTPIEALKLQTCSELLYY